MHLRRPTRLSWYSLDLNISLQQSTFSSDSGLMNTKVKTPFSSCCWMLSSVCFLPTNAALSPLFLSIATRSTIKAVSGKTTTRMQLLRIYLWSFSLLLNHLYPKADGRAMYQRDFSLPVVDHTNTTLPAKKACRLCFCSSVGSSNKTFELQTKLLSLQLQQRIFVLALDTHCCSGSIALWFILKCEILSTPHYSKKCRSAISFVAQHFWS